MNQRQFQCEKYETTLLISHIRKHFGRWAGLPTGRNVFRVFTGDIRVDNFQGEWHRQYLNELFQGHKTTGACRLQASLKIQLQGGFE